MQTHIFSTALLRIHGKRHDGAPHSTPVVCTLRAPEVESAFNVSHTMAILEYTTDDPSTKLACENPRRCRRRRAKATARLLCKLWAYVPRHLVCVVLTAYVAVSCSGLLIAAKKPSPPATSAVQICDINTPHARWNCQRLFWNPCP